MALHSYYPSPATKEREKSFSSKRLKTTTDFWLLRDLFIGLVLLSPNTVRGSSFFVLTSLVFHCLAQAKLDGGHPPPPPPATPPSRRPSSSPVAVAPPPHGLSSLVEDPIGGEQQGRRPSKAEVGLRDAAWADAQGRHHCRIGERHEQRRGGRAVGRQEDVRLVRPRKKWSLPVAAPNIDMGLKNRNASWR
jgi:hypothetical protein